MDVCVKGIWMHNECVKSESEHLGRIMPRMDNGQGFTEQE